MKPEYDFSKGVRGKFYRPNVQMNNNLLSVDIPDRLKKRPVYHGFPIPFTTMIGPDGVPDFKVTDMVARDICVKERRCSLCEDQLEYWVYYIGSKEHIQGEIFFDTAMHEECAEYAAKVCPYLAFGKAYGNHIKPMEGVKIYEIAPRELLSNEGVPVYLARGRRSDITRTSDEVIYFVRSGPLHDVQLIERRKA